MVKIGLWTIARKFSNHGQNSRLGACPPCSPMPAPWQKLFCVALQSDIGTSELCRCYQLHRKWRALSVVFDVRRS